MTDAGPVELVVNGTRHEVACDPDTPLLYVLRNDLGLVGAKFGCGLGLCGACNVLVDGHPTHSCDTPVWAVAGKQVTTVEGLGGHPLQGTFVEEQALQCGYCTSGMLVTAAALLEREPEVDDDGVRRALDGNLCRCGAHNRIVRAVLGARPCGR
ncbi:(2Fe-2S)-binding protein [Blastococcus sp. CT_GayMR16]|uniref:(2Fe-2S)-binding protein n=1 Tax=Blastococcus sp. CT_GayMR16 TaxID=2559607 RepID=UPI001ADD7DB1|nr:(2Fe-2S)-binding protein [Blastococcus sp. CT_GayMR16]